MFTYNNVLLVVRFLCILQEMVFKEEKLRLKRLLVEAISLLCRNGLPVHSSFRIEATIGITLSEDEVVLVSFQEVVQPDGAMVSEVNGSEEVSNEACDVQSDDSLDCHAEPEMKNTIHANQRSSLPAKMIDDEDSATLEQTNIWNENFTASGDSMKPRNRKISSKYCSSKLPQENLVIPDAQSLQTGSFLESSLDDAKVCIKDEALDDGDCTFVKVEDVADDCLGTFEALEQDDSLMYQAYNEANIFSTGSHGLVQPTQGFNYSTYNVQAGLHSPSSMNFSSHEMLKSVQRRRCNFVDDGRGVAHPGVRPNLTDSSHSQVSGFVVFLSKDYIVFFYILATILVLMKFIL